MSVVAYSCLHELVCLSCSPLHMVALLKYSEYKLLLFLLSDATSAVVDARDPSILLYVLCLYAHVFVVSVNTMVFSKLLQQTSKRARHDSVGSIVTLCSLRTLTAFSLISTYKNKKQAQTGGIMEKDTTAKSREAAENVS